MLQNEPDRAYYGFVKKLYYSLCYNFFLIRLAHVERANELNAIEMLMVTDELFRYNIATALSKIILLSWIC